MQPRGPSRLPWYAILARRAVMVATLGAVLGVAPLGAQSVRGVVAHNDGVTAARGVVVLLLRATNDSVVARAVTSSRGGYLLRAPAPGTYRVRLLRLGIQPETLAPLTLQRDESVERNVVLLDAQVVLAAFDVRTNDQCRTRPDSGLLVAQLLGEARKALLASVSTSLDGESQSEYEIFTHIEDTRRRLVTPERVQTVTRPSAHPFSSLPPDSLAKVGYVMSAGDSVVYRGPDAEVLLSDAFAAGHCFQVVQGTGARAASIGVAFRPLAAKPELTDIRGTIWMERETGALQSVEFTFEPIPDVDTKAGVGGDVDFSRTESGLWIVSRWNIRMPRVVFRTIPGPPSLIPAPLQTVRAIEGIHRTGGDVVSVRVGDILHYQRTTGPARVANSVTTTRDVAALPMTEHPVCGAVGMLSDSGATEGRVTVDGVRGDAGALVIARWRDFRLVNDARNASYQDHSRETKTVAGGDYVLCGLPLDKPITVHVERDGSRSAATSLRLLDSEPVITSNLRFANAVVVAAGPLPDSLKAQLRLRVRRDDGTPVPDAEVTARIQAITRTVRSDNEGDAYLVDLPPGLVEIGVRRIGSAAKTVRASIEPGRNELTVQMAGSTVVLEGVRVIGNRVISARHAEIDSRILRGEANAVVTRRDIERRNPINLSQMLRGMAGLRVSDSAGAKVAVSTRGAKIDRSGNVLPCVMRVMLDGIIMSESNDIDNVLPVDVYAVEAYFGAARIPPQFAGTRNDSWCGLIAIWTR